MQMVVCGSLPWHRVSGQPWVGRKCIALTLHEVDGMKQEQKGSRLTKMVLAMKYPDVLVQLDVLI